VIAQVAGAYRAHWRTLLIAGLLVFMPLAVVEMLDAELQEPFADADLNDLDPGLVAALVAAIIGHATASLLGEVVYAGIIAAAVTSGGDRPNLRELLRHLPLRRLICVDLLWVAVVAVGFLALFIPGVIFIAWFALVAPAVEVEGRTVLSAFGRSRELVRRRFWLVLGLVLPIFILADALASAVQSASWWGFGDGVVGDWVGTVLANLISSPPYALVAVFLFLGLRELAEQGADGEPVAAA
jgi:hypothetical protein